MIAVSEGTPKDGTMQDLIKYLLRPRRPKIQVRLRPYCPVHEKPMLATRKRDGFVHYRCSEPGCCETWKGRQPIV